MDADRSIVDDEREERRASRVWAYQAPNTAAAWQRWAFDRMLADCRALEEHGPVFRREKALALGWDLLTAAVEGHPRADFPDVPAVVRGIREALVFQGYLR